MVEPKQNSNTHRTPTQILTLASDSEWREAAVVMRVLRPSLNTEQFVARREQLVNEGYCLLGVCSGESVVSIASYTISPHVTLGRELLIHDMATLPEMQGQGHASSLIVKLVQIAEQHSCGRIFVHTRHAQALYQRGGFEEYSTGMVRKF